MFRNSTQYVIAGTETFRLGSRKIQGIWGGNMQNIPKNLRHLYVSDEGKVLLQADQSGAEALIVAYLCKPGNYRKLFTCGINPHAFTALHIFADKWKEHIKPVELARILTTPIEQLKTLPGFPALIKLIKSSDDWPADKRYYYMSKKVGHASNYDMKGPTYILDLLKESEGNVVLSLKEGNRQLEARRNLFPEIEEWHYEIQDILSKDRILFNLFGYPREFGGDMAAATFREAYAFIPQSTVGSITNIAFTNLQQYIEANNLSWDILGNCHDSYVVQCPHSDIAACAKMMYQFMCQELVGPRGDHFRMKCEVQVGHNWGPYKADKNPDGLQTYEIAA